MFISDLNSNVKLTAGCNPRHLLLLKYRTSFFPSQTQNKLKARR